jgi:hypothetical protein
MRIRVFASDSNPDIDPPLLKKPIPYCQGEVDSGRAKLVNADDITAGIHLLPSKEARKHQIDRRGSPESRGLLTAHESHLNAQYHCNSKVDQAVADGRACFVPSVEVPLLAWDYESKLAKHEAEGRKGTPMACAVIAARVKTLLSDPVLIQV